MYEHIDEYEDDYYSNQENLNPDQDEDDAQDSDESEQENFTENAKNINN